MLITTRHTNMLYALETLDYVDDPKCAWHETVRARAIRERDAVRALGREPTPDEVEAILGHSIDGHCNECGKRVQRLVRLGDEPDYESNTAYICIDCLRRAITALEEAK